MAAYPTRTVNNTGHPITAPDGTVVANTTITFTLVSAAGTPVDAIDATTLERVVGRVTTQTDSIGEFSVALWPNSRGSTSTFYHVKIHYPNVASFVAALPDGVAALDWVSFQLSGAALTAGTITALDAHIADATNPHSVTAAQAGAQPLDAALTALAAGTIDGVAIGGTTPAAGSFSTLSTAAPLTVPNGGLGLGAITADCLLVGTGTTAPSLLAPSTAGYVLTDNGPGVAPSYQALPAGVSPAQTNYTAIVPPTITDDSSAGYSAGSVWIDTAASPKEAYVCADATAGAAIWLNTTLELSELGSMASQSAGAVAITGGSVTGITDVAVADGGTGASTASGARTNLGLGTIATQAASAVAITGGSVAGVTDIAVADGGTGASTASGARTNLGLGTIATQAASAVAVTGGAINGTTIGGVTPAAGTFTTLTATGGAITGITDLAVADGGTGASTASGARTNLGLGTIATQAASAVAITGGSIAGITDLAVADGGTGSSTASGARTNLGLGTIATQAASAVALTGGAIDGTAIGGTTPAAGNFSAVTMSGAVSMADNLLQQAEIKDYSETVVTPSSSAGTLTLDMSAGNVFEVTLTENVTTLAITNPPASGKAGSLTLILHQGAAAAYTFAWPASSKWAGGTAPTVTATIAATDVYTLATTDAAVTLYGFSGGQAFA